MTAGMQLKERDGARLYTTEHGKVLAEAGFEIDTAPMVAAVLGSMAEVALAPEQIHPQVPYPRRCRSVRPRARTRCRRDTGIHAGSWLRPPAGAAVAPERGRHGSTVFINITLYADHSDTL